MKSAMLASVIGLLCVSGLAAAQSTPAPAPGPGPEGQLQSSLKGGFISAQGQKFVDKDCNEFVFSGANVWQLVEAQAGVEGGSPDDVEKMFSTAQENGLNIIRFFPFGILSTFTLQTAPGVYNQKNWDALDSIVDTASKSGVRLIMPFADNWIFTDGKLQYVEWAGEKYSDSFYTSDKVKTLYKNNIKAMTSHVNAINGIAFKDDPTIFAWDLMNEPRSACNTSDKNVSCTPTAAEWIQEWIVDISKYVKEVDPNHMVTVGEEGFFGASSPQAKLYDPGDEFATTCGQDFVKNHSPDTIDFAATHIWIDNWQTNASFCGRKGNPSCGTQFIDNWIKSHAADSASILNKPLVVEEFGNGAYKSPPDLAIQNPVYKAVYDPYLSYLKTGQPDVHGVAFWQWVFSPGLNASYSDSIYALPTGSGVWDDEVVPSFSPTIDYLAAKKPVANCIPGDKVAQNSTATSSAGRRLMASSK